MSTPELLRAEEPRLVGRIGHTPRVNHERNKTKQVAAQGNRMKAGELFGGVVSLHFGGAPVFNLVNLFDLGSEDLMANEAEAEDQNDEAKGETAEWPARINHFRKEMADRDDATDEIHGEITPNQVLRDDASIVITEDNLHLFAEGCGRNPKGKKES